MHFIASDKLCFMNSFRGALKLEGRLKLEHVKKLNCNNHPTLLPTIFVKSEDDTSFFSAYVIAILIVAVTALLINPCIMFVRCIYGRRYRKIRIAILDDFRISPDRDINQVHIDISQ